jgi:broad specificity phosphatase PhoE
MPLRRLVLIRHGETDGQSSVRLYGATDVDLAPDGREQMRRASLALGPEGHDLVVASPLKRSWRSAWIAGRGVPVRIESDFREIHFGRWEGMTREEIQARDPVRFEDWQRGGEDFEYPGGEAVAGFRERVGRGLERLLANEARSALVVVHKGVVREIARRLTGQAVGRDEPAVGEGVVLTRRPDGSWFRGRRSSNPPALEEPGAAA